MEALSKPCRRAGESEAMKPREVGQYLIAHPGICFGKPTFKGTRVPVRTVLTFLAQGETIEDVLEGWPELQREAVVEAIELAATALEERYALKPETTDEPAHSGRST
jgi:uncharacterized protein (DUF433 family)